MSTLKNSGVEGMIDRGEFWIVDEDEQWKSPHHIGSTVVILADTSYLGGKRKTWAQASDGSCQFRHANYSCHAPLFRFVFLLPIEHTHQLNAQNKALLSFKKSLFINHGF